MRALLLFLLMLMGAAPLCAPVWAQAPSGVERVRERIETLRGVAARTAKPQQPAERAPGSAVSERDLQRLERRLIRLLRTLLRAPRPAADAAPASAAPQARQRDSGDGNPAPGTAAPLPDSVRVVERVVERLVERDAPPDTVRKTTVLQIRASMLDTGLFRAFEVSFAFGTSTLAPRAQRTLDAIGDLLTDVPQLRLEIAGHTDAVGEAAYNQRLSEARAEAVKRYLVDAFALRPDRLTTRGYGEKRPIASNETADARALNRRVEFVAQNPAVLQRSGSSPSDTLRTSDDELQRLIRRLVRSELRRLQAAPDSALPDRVAPDSTMSVPERR